VFSFFSPSAQYQTPNTKHETTNTMHEMGIALQIIEIATASLPADLGEVRVAAVNLKIGKLAAVVPASLRFCFDVAVKDTPLAGAKLAIEEVPVVARCKDCNARWTIDEPVFICKTCESGSLEILSGRELDIESIEVVEEENNDSG
jgi:hydrogenase nickel incorporation protein HypA/HybF